MTLEELQENSPIESRAEKMALSLKELSLIGNLLLTQFEEILNNLRSRRSPIQLDILEQLAPLEESQQSFEKSLKNLEALLQEHFEWKSLQNKSSPLQEAQLLSLLEIMDAIKQDQEAWLHFFQLSRSLISRLELIASQERLSAGAWASILDVWEELEQSARGTENFEEEEPTL